MGLMDWLTTTIGISYFGAVEANPFIAGIAGTSLLAFTVVKLCATLFAALLFYQGERLLLGTQDKTKLSFKCARILLRGTCIAATAFLLFAVVNNLIVVATAI
jgi:predicted secreted protein